MNSKYYPYFVITALVVALGIAGNEDYKAITNASKVQFQQEERLSAMENKLAKFLANENSPAPVLVAKAAARQKRPRLIAAVAAVESNASPFAVGKVGERGAWQVRPQFHGPVSKDVYRQADQAADILEELIQKHDGKFKPALSAYNGDSTGRYAKRVYQALARLEATK